MGHRWPVLQQIELDLEEDLVARQPMAGLPAPAAESWLLDFHRPARPPAPCNDGAMAEGTKRKQLKTFPGLQAEDFQHDDDVAATAFLRAVPGLDTLVAKVMEYGFERVYYLENMAAN